MAWKQGRGPKNSYWKGDNVGYTGLHSWVKRNKPKSELCEKCKNAKPYDLANISQKYKRDINDFEWLCRKCHMEKDGRLKLFPDRYPNRKGTLNGRARFTEKEIRIIKHALSFNVIGTATQLAKMFKVHKTYIEGIKYGRYWKHITI